MTRRWPVAAMLWELWRVTRAEIAWKLAVGLVVPLTAVIVSAVFEPAERAKWYLAVGDGLAWIGKVLVYLPHIMGWLSLAALNNGRAGFPLYLHYSRPVRTVVIVGLPMAYVTLWTFAISLTSAFLLSVTAGYTASLLPSAAWLATLISVLTAIAWSTRGMATLLGVLVALFGGGNAIGWRLDSFPKGIDYPLTDYAVMALIGLACFGVTVARVTRQRRGDTQPPIVRTPGSGLWEWLVDLFRVPCPTSSAARAQMWSILKTNGLPLLTTGVVVAAALVMVSVVSEPIDAAWNADPSVSCPIKECFWARAMPPLFAPLGWFGVLLAGRNAFGIRRRQGRAYVTAFEATQAQGTAQLAVINVLAKSICVLAALIAIGVGAWISIPILGDPVFIQMWNVPLSSRLPAITRGAAALAAYEQLSLALVPAFGVVIWVAALAVFGALRIRFPWRASIAAFLLVLYGLVFAWLAVGVRVDPKTTAELHLDVVYGAMCWIATAAMAITTVFVSWRGFTERVLTIRYAAGAVALSAAFGAAWLTVLQMAGAPLAEMSALNLVLAASPALLALMASVLAPWSYSRLRHT